MKDPMKLDLYELFNIKITATQSEIKTAYRKKALICHPDKNPDNPKAAEEFKLLHKAKEILTDVSARADYDKILRTRKEERSSRIRKDVKVDYGYRMYFSYKTATKKSTKETECPKHSKEERRKPNNHTSMPEKPNPFWFNFQKSSKKYFKNQSTSSTQTKNENKPSKRKWSFSEDTNSPFTNPLFSRTRMNGDTFKRNTTYNWFFASGKNEKKTPPRAYYFPRANAENGNDTEENMKSFKFPNFTPIVKPATFVPPASKDSDNFTNNKPGVFSQNSRPIIKPATFVPPTSSPSSTGFPGASQKCSSPIKPATFVPPF